MKEKEHANSDRKFLAYNKRNVLTNLLQAEEHIKAMNTLSFIRGEGSCVLKHLLVVRGELAEAISHASSLGEDTKIYEKLKDEIESFLDGIEAKPNSFTKRDLLNKVRGWRKEFEQTSTAYLTFRCKCLHAIPYLKLLFGFTSGVALGILLHKFLLMLGV